MGGLIHASGSRLEAFWGEQVDFDTKVQPDKLLIIAYPEEVRKENEYESTDEPSKSRDIKEFVKQGENVTGTLNFRVRTQSMGMWYKSALSSDEDVVTIPNANGNIRAELFSDYSSGSVFLPSLHIPDTWTDTGHLAIVHRTDGDIGKQLVSVVDLEYTAINVARTQFTLASPISALIADSIKREDQIIRYEDTAGVWNGVFTHFFFGGQELNTHFTLGLLRHIVMADYSKCKCSSFTEEIPLKDKLRGSFEFLGGNEFWGAYPESDIAPGATSLVLEDRTTLRDDFGVFTTGYPEFTFWIGSESGITATAYDSGTGTISGIPASGPGSIANIHNILPFTQIVALQTAPDITPKDLNPVLKAENASMGIMPYGVQGFPETAFRFLSASYTVNNELDPDKVFAGSTDRAALPDGIRTTEGTAEIELDSPREYDYSVQELRWRAEFNFRDSKRFVNGVNGIRPANFTILPKIIFTGDTPTTPDSSAINFNTPFLAEGVARNPSIIKGLVNDQSEAVSSA